MAFSERVAATARSWDAAAARGPESRYLIARRYPGCSEQRDARNFQSARI